MSFSFSEKHFSIEEICIFFLQLKYLWRCALEIKETGTSLEVQWLWLHAPNAGGTGSIPGCGTKIPHAIPRGQKKKKKKEIKETALWVVHEIPLNCTI